MGRQRDRESAGLDELRHRLTETDLIPSQEPLLEDLGARIASLEKAGVSSALSCEDFTWLGEKVVSSLNDAGIKNTDLLNGAVAGGVARLEQELGLKDGALAEVAALSDVSRVQWVSPNFAGALVAAGYRTAAALAVADPELLYEAVARANDRSGFYKSIVGRRDIQRVVQASRYVHWAARDSATRNNPPTQRWP
ncbi:MAG: DUF4332 domain-containing protein [Acidimicrobiales bacterium]